MSGSRQFLRPDQVFDGVSLHPGAAVELAQSRVAGLVPAGQMHTGPDVIRVTGILTPGFVDLQVNGGGGVLFNDEPTPAGMRKIAAAHRRFGTTHILPTVITDAPEVLARAVDAALDQTAGPGILGIHIEGPYIAPTRRGTHATRFVRPLDATTIAHAKRLRAAGIPTMITLAPEAAPPDEIARLAAMGCIISIGHSDATADQTRAALAAGANCFTHLFNAMSPMLNRSPGVVGAAINSDAYAGIICDGIHVADEMVALALRARPVPDRTFLVSDAMPTVGGPDRFELYGETITLTDGRLINAEGSLAGAHVTMLGSVRRLVHHAGVDLETALRMATGIPMAVVRGQASPSPVLDGVPVEDLLLLDAGLTGFQTPVLEPTFPA